MPSTCPANKLAATQPATRPLECPCPKELASLAGGIAYTHIIINPRWIITGLNFELKTNDFAPFLSAAGTVSF